MPRKRPSRTPVAGPAQPNWYLREWMATLQLRQADMMRRTDTPRATMSKAYNGETDYYRELLNRFAAALNIHPYELLMHPDDAMAIRRLRSSAQQIASVQMAADVSREWMPDPGGHPAFKKLG
jgi:transcriptional regulator with XRE-family HTH domain